MKGSIHYCLLFVLLIAPIHHSVRVQVEHLPESCDYSHCPKVDPSKLNVHLVPHTHDDVGWLKTVDQYYYGSRQSIQKAGVQYILDSVVNSLIRNKDRRFIYVETAFFAKWWMEQNEQTKDIVRELVSTGQLEFINGGWCMNDEATTHYSAIIDQMTLGLKFLNETFGPKCGVPKVAWHIDPFGHSREQASLFAMMNFDGFIFSRIDFEDHARRRAYGTMEHVWSGSDDLGSSSDIFVSIINDGYRSPEGFNWDLIDGKDEPVIDNPESEEYNVDDIVNRFTETSLIYQKIYNTNHIMFPMGEDFQYQSAHSWYKNMDKLIKYVNEKQDKIRVFYSTPSCYINSLHNLNRTFETNKADFFPYASLSNAYWTGFYTSRPTLKRMERVANNWLQACKQVDVFAANHGTFEHKLFKLKDAMGIMQHHDAVAGTEKQHVANDYAKLLQIGLDESKQILSSSLQKLITENSLSMPKKTDHLYCDLLNISSCDATEQLENFAVTLYNPYSQPLVNYTVRLPIQNGKFYEVLGPDQKYIQSVLFPIPEWVRSIPERKSLATKELVFHVNIGALGYVTYFVQSTNKSTTHSASEALKLKITEEKTIDVKDLTLVLCKNGELCKVHFNNQTVSLESKFNYYKSFAGDRNFFWLQSSGAYIFRPEEEIPKPLDKQLESILYSDPEGVFFEVHQKFDSFVQKSIKFERYKYYVEYDWFVGSIPINDEIGKEVIVRYETNLQTNQTFYTDSNGRQLMKRVLNYRPTWNYTVFEPVAGNYYPVNSRMLLRDPIHDIQLSVLTDRSQGGTSLSDGTAELMLHRRILLDDNFGVSEALNETGLDGNGLMVRGSHFLIIDTIRQSDKKHRTLGQQLYLRPIISFSNGTKSEVFAHQTKFSALKKALPENINILTLEYWRKDQILLRLEHVYQSNEDSELSRPELIDLLSMFHNVPVGGVEELTLAANQPISAIKNRFVFEHENQHKVNATNDIDSFLITMKPMQIRTFVIHLKNNYIN